MAKYTTVAQVSAAVEALEEQVAIIRDAVRALYTMMHPDPTHPEPQYPYEIPDPETDLMGNYVATQDRREWKRHQTEMKWLTALGGRIEEEPDPDPPVEEPATPIDEPATPIEEPATPIEEPATPIEEPATP